MDRILHIIGTMDRGGAETLLMTIYRKIDRSKYQFDFLVHASDEGDYDAEIRELGGNVYHIKPYAVVNTLSYQKSFKELLIILTIEMSYFRIKVYYVHSIILDRSDIDYRP